MKPKIVYNYKLYIENAWFYCMDIDVFSSFSINLVTFIILEYYNSLYNFLRSCCAHP